MAVDLEAIVRHGQCELSALKNALPLIEQGYSPPFLARYRRDELGGVDEASLWAASTALAFDEAVRQQRDQLYEKWQATKLADPSLGNAIRKTNSKRTLDRLARRLKKEDTDNVSESGHLAVRLLNPSKGDGSDLNQLCEALEAVQNTESALAGLDAALASRLSGDPRVISAAVRWLARNAKIHVSNISDPHKAESAAEEPASDGEKAVEAPAANKQEVKTAPEDTAEGKSDSVEVKTESVETRAEADSPTEQVASEPEAEQVVAEPTPDAANAAATPEQPVEATESPTESATEPAATGPETPALVAGAEPNATSAEPVAEATPQKSAEPAAATPKPKSKKARAKKEPKKQKKISPRQRRRRWLVSVLKPLEGKRLVANKISSFQIVMLGRALRSQVAQCTFEYDANKLVAEIQKTVSGINRNFEQKLKEIVLEHEAGIREAAEAAWWDELHEKASSKLLGIAADQLHDHINRGAVDANVVMSIDAVGPRTAATTIVASDGHVVHCEDLPCQLSGSLRAQAVNKIGELIHAHNVDLIVVSNGPARRSCMVAMSDLINQSPDNSIRWTLADRSGADAYASSDMANQEMRSTPRRFRASAWLAFSVLQPAQAYAKVDPLKLRLASFQRELSDEALSSTLESVMISGASRGGVDVNSASSEWIARLPGMSPDASKSIDKRRRKDLWRSRNELLESETWQNVVHSRQAIPFLRVFGSEEVLDGTLIHPDDYVLAKKLANTLGIELPPASPPGYETPSFEKDEAPADPGLVAEVEAPKTQEVEDVSAAVEGKASETFAEDVKLGAESSAEDSPVNEESNTETEPEQSEDQPSDDGSQPETPAEESGAEPAVADASETTDASESADSNDPADASPEDKSSEESSSEPEPAAADSSVVNHEPVRRPRPERAQIDKCIKEWQVGKRRVNQIVNWLCDPFGDSDVSNRAPAVMNTMPTLKQLKPGDEVIGVVVGVVGFGVFVELAPDCSGLIHVSKVSDRYVDDLHEAIQVGDVITTWVTGIDDKKRRVALSAVSPEREEELKQQRENQRQNRGQKGGGRGRDGNRRPNTAKSGGGGKPGGGKPSGGQSRGSGKPRSDRGGGRGRDNRGGGRGRGKKPETYRVVSKTVAAPISEAMQKGEEPLRSFGDLMQFYTKEDDKPAEKPAKEPKVKKEKKPSADSTGSTETTSEVAPEPTPTSAEAAPDAKQPDSQPASPEATAKPAEETVEAPEQTSDFSEPCGLMSDDFQSRLESAIARGKAPGAGDGGRGQTQTIIGRRDQANALFLPPNFV